MGYHPAPEGWWEKFVSADPSKTAKLAIVRADGSPHVVPVWVDLDQDADGGTEIVFTTGRDTAKGKALQRDDRVSLCWDDEAPPFAFVTVRGRARLVDDPAQVRAWAGRLGGRYMGADRAEEYAARNGVPGEVVVRVRPEKVVAMVDLAE
jgi:PPOX class probable F420-dependent enzyme